MRNFFVALDVETANSSRASICQIGLVGWAEGRELWRWSTLINPHEDFDERNYNIHKIHPRDVADAPSYNQVHSSLCESVTGQCLVSWTEFDAIAFAQCSHKYQVGAPHCDWLDARNLAREVWPHLPNYELKTVAQFLGIEYDAHNAEADAWACAVATNRALEQTRTTVDDWLPSCAPTFSAPYTGPAKVLHPVIYAREGVSGGPLQGHVALFTGDFEIGKSRMMDLAAKSGANVKTNWSKKITLLVVGNRDPEKFGGSIKSSKHRMAEEAQREGQEVAIMTERQFLDWLATL